ncbi:hypothetical protein [Micromonospora auratinigra]|uniref:Tat (Twin-arginine translocation) pathway signal sequence n=1 Tax=Micromonospora auratinigra TaxID=261654 RepID=A0A1A8ZIM7_9ACTN|nr:hypothetical protein [Micromonospora auratinigra]SBT43691.1 hypothetical protein GA0070611_2421 [Micromonospora auratinigra]
MPQPSVLSRAAGVPGRVLAALAAVALALGVAFVVAPSRLAAGGSGGDFDDRRQLVDAVHAEFVGWWRSGEAGFPPGLQRVVDYWFRYHLAKAVLAGALLVVLGALAVLLWRALLRAGGLPAGTRAMLGAAGVLVTMLALAAVALVMANVQGAAAPFASLLSMLPDGPADARLAVTLAQVRHQLTDGGTAAAPAVAVMTDDFARYHAVLAALAATVAVALAAVGVRTWRARARFSERPARRLLGSLAAASVLVFLAVLVVAVANTGTAADPAPALLAFFEGGW